MEPTIVIEANPGKPVPASKHMLRYENLCLIFEKPNLDRVLKNFRYSAINYYTAVMDCFNKYLSTVVHEKL